MPPQLNQAGRAARSLKLDDHIYQIRHPSISLFEASQLKTFAGKDEARAFLQQFELDHDTLSTLILEGDWKNNPAVWDKDRQIDKLAELILANEMVITQRKAPTPPKAESTAALPTSDVGNRQAGLGPETSEGLHNRDDLEPEVKRGSFKPAKQVDMKNLSNDEKTAVRELKSHGSWKRDKVQEILESGNDFTTKELKPGDKLYGFNTAGRGKNVNKSAYWLDEAGYKKVQSKYFKDGRWDKEGVKNHLALPCYNKANAVDVAEVTKPTTAVESTTGKATESIKYNGKDGYTTGQMGKIMGGGGKQVTVAPSAIKAI